MIFTGRRAGLLKLQPCYFDHDSGLWQGQGPVVTSGGTGFHVLDGFCRSRATRAPVRVDEIRNVVVRESTDPAVIIAEQEAATIIATGRQSPSPSCSFSEPATL